MPRKAKSRFHVTFEQVDKRLAKLRNKLRTERAREAYAAVLRASLRRKDWNDEVRRGMVKKAELAFALVVAVEAFSRVMDDRLPDASLRSTGFERKPLGPVLPTAMVPLWCEPVEPAPEPYREPPPITQPTERDFGRDDDHHGFQLGNIVDEGDEISWLYGESALATGMSSNWDGLVVKAATYGAAFTCQEPAGPSDQMMFAAERQAEVLQAMRKVPPRLQAILGVAYEDRRCEQQTVTTYGRGVALVVLRAIRDAGSTGLALRELEMWAYGVEHGAPGHETEGRLKRAATTLLERAQAAYLAARRPEEPRAKEAPLRDGYGYLMPPRRRKGRSRKPSIERLVAAPIVERFRGRELIIAVPNRAA